MPSLSRTASLARWIRGAVLLCLLALPTASSALTVITSDPSVAAAFQTGATIEGFDDLSALTITSYSGGQTVPAGNQFSSRNLLTFTSPFFNSGGATFTDPVTNPGTRIGIFDPDGAISADVRSPNNVAGPLATGSDEAFTNGFIEVIFPADVQRVGFWITEGSNIQLILKDSGNMNLTGEFMVTGSEGQFIGIQRDSADVRGVTIGFGTFTLDDFTYAATPIPEPSSFGLVALGLAALVGWRRTR